MDSRLDSIFRTTFRTTEQTDSWLGIRREDAHDDRKPKHHDKKDDADAVSEEGASLSLPALYGFLQGLVAGQPGHLAASSPIAPPHTSPPPVISPATSPTTSRAAAAMRAYQTSARSTGTPHVDLHDAPPAIAAPAIDLSTEEIRIIHQLLADIAVLAGRNVMTITLRPAENFLGSLVAGVAEMMEHSDS